MTDKTEIFTFVAIRQARIKKDKPWGWGDGSEVKDTYLSCRRPGFSSQYSHGGSQPTVTPIPGDV